MGALTDQRKRSSTDLRLPLSSTSPKKPRLLSPSSSPILPNLPHPSPFRRPVHGPQRIIRAFGLGSSSTKRWTPSNSAKIGSFFSQLNRKKQDEGISLVEFKQLVEERFDSPGDDFVKVSSSQQKSTDFKQDEGLSLEEFKHLVEERFESPGDDVDKVSSSQQKSTDFSTRNEADTLDVLDIVIHKAEGKENVASELVQIREARKLVKNKPLYKELYAKAKECDPKLNDLKFEEQVLCQKVIGIRIEAEFLRKKEKSKEELEELFRPLTSKEEEDLSLALFSGNSRKVLVAHESSNIQITRESLQCFRPGAWLNDEVINLYLELLKEREKREPKRFLKCHFFNTFFYKKLISEKHGYDFKAVKRWTTQRKLGYALIECDKIFVPIHKEIHWCLAIINVKDESFQYLDSLGGLDNYVLKMLARYLKEEVRDKSGKEIDPLSWKKESVEELPLQKNGWDCGMFMLKYVDFYSRGLKLRFSQEHMSYFRKRTALDILRLNAG